MGWNEVDPGQGIGADREFPAGCALLFRPFVPRVCASWRRTFCSGLSYGASTFAAAFERGNLMGAQFHPEKSHRFGMTFLRNFVERF